VLQVHALRASLKFSTLDKYFFLPFFFFLQFLSYPELVFPISDFAYHSELVQLSSPSESVGYLLSSHCAVQASLMAPVYVDNVHLKHSKRSCRYRNIFVYSKQAKEPSLCTLQFTISSYNLHLSLKYFLNIVFFHPLVTTHSTPWVFLQCIKHIPISKRSVVSIHEKKNKNIT
jgi:hypothetical protein